MLVITSKKIIAVKSNPLINDKFDDIQEWLNGTYPAYKGTYDSGSPKKNTFGLGPGMGSNDRGHNPGAGMGLGRDPEESSDRGLGSGYNDGGRVDDEIGPGNKSPNPATMREGDQPGNSYTSQSDNNEMFRALEIQENSGLDSGELTSSNPNEKKSLKDLLHGKAVTLPHTRYNNLNRS